MPHPVTLPTKRHLFAHHGPSKDIHPAYNSSYL
jgi:hypothetical protein